MEKQGNNDSGQLLLASLGKLTKEKTEFHAKIQQLLASQNVVKNTTDARKQFKSFYVCPGRENHLSSSHRSQVVRNQ